MSGLRVSSVLVLVVVAACGSVEGNPDLVSSGSRLRAKFLVDADGDRQFAGFHDTQRNEDCDFTYGYQQTDARCLPALSYAYTYADAGCTQPLLEWYQANECGTLPTYLAQTVPDSCTGELAHVWKLGTQAQVNMIYTGAPGACTPQPPSSGYVYFGVAAEVPLDQFQSGKVTLEDGGRLRNVVVLGDDGSRVPAGTRDTQLDTDCYIFGDPLRCVPNANSTSYFSDAGCTAGVVAQQTSCAAQVSAYSVHFMPQTCGYSYTLAKLGAPITPTMLYNGTPQSCSPATIPTDTSFWSVGADLPLDQLETVTTAPSDTGGRLQRKVETTADGFTLTVPSFHDKQLGIDCYPILLDDGKTRCAPATALGTVSEFSDASCTQPVVVAQAYPNGCAFTAPPYAEESIPDGPCTSHQKVDMLGAEIASGTIYSGSPGACTALTWDPTQLKYFQVGAAVPASTFVELTLKTE